MSLRPRPINFEESWSKLRDTIRDVLTLQKIPRQIWNDRFTDVYSVCVAFPEPLADKLYFETKQFLSNYVDAQLANIRENSETIEQNIISEYYKVWSSYSKGIGYLNKLYLYMNQQHIRRMKLTEIEYVYGMENMLEDKLEIGELGLEIWKENMIVELKQRLVEQILLCIANDRNGIENTIKTEEIEETVASFVAVEECKGLRKKTSRYYEDILEKKFLDESVIYFKQQSSKLVSEVNVSDYMEEMIVRLNQECERVTKYLQPSTIPKIREVFQWQMIAEHKAFLYSDIKTIVGQEKTKDMSNMFLLLRNVPNGLDIFIEEFLEHIKKEGLAEVSSLSGDTAHIQFVENILKIHDKYKKTITDVFLSDQRFIGALDKACGIIINHRDNSRYCKSPELLARYCDSLLKKSTKTVNESEIDTKLASCIIVFKYLYDKDVFQKFYSRMFAKRLIHQQSQSMEAEEQMINRLKQACGYEFTNKFHRMYTDISLCADLNNKFDTYLKTQNVTLNHNFQIYVLQAGAWPLGQNVQNLIALPSEFVHSVATFETFYRVSFNGRKLTWLYHLSQGELKLGYLKKNYIITMQTYQLAIMMLFEKTDELSVKDIQEILQTTHEQLVKHIVSLIDCKLLISNTEELCESSVLKLNLDFSNKRTKFRITAAIPKENNIQEAESTITSVEEDRKLYLQAAIVRIMKARKILRHNDLIQEILSQNKASFSPSIPLIKKCIESLIEKQYLERTPNVADSYSYVA